MKSGELKSKVKNRHTTVLKSDQYLYLIVESPAIVFSFVCFDLTLYSITPFVFVEFVFVNLNDPIESSTAGTIFNS